MTNSLATPKGVNKDKMADKFKIVIEGEQQPETPKIIGAHIYKESDGTVVFKVDGRRICALLPDGKAIFYRDDLALVGFEVIVED